MRLSNLLKLLTYIHMNKKAVMGTLSTVALGLFALVGVSSAHAAGFGVPPTADEIATRQTTMFQNEATLLGLSLDDVKAAWAKGETIPELMKEKNISQTDIEARQKAQRDTQLKTQLAALVSKGVITQAQADARLAFLQTQTSKGKGRGGMMSGFGGMGRGHGRGGGFGGGMMGGFGW